MQGWLGHGNFENVQNNFCTFYLYFILSDSNFCSIQYAMNINESYAVMLQI